MFGFDKAQRAKVFDFGVGILKKVFSTAKKYITPDNVAKYAGYGEEALDIAGTAAMAMGAPELSAPLLAGAAGLKKVAKIAKKVGAVQNAWNGT